MKLFICTTLAMMVISARAMPEPESYAEPDMMYAPAPMNMMKMGMHVVHMMMEKMTEAKPIMDAVYSDGASPELAMQLLTIHQDLEKDFQKMTGMPVPMAMFGEAGIQNAKMAEMMMEEGMAMLEKMMDMCREKKRILDTINTEGATPELAMQLMTTMQESANMLMYAPGAHQMLMWGGKKSVMKGMEMAMELTWMMMSKMPEMMDVTKTMAMDGVTPELALQFLTIKEDFSTGFTEITGMPCSMTMMGETGMENIKMLGMMLAHMDMGTDLVKMITGNTMKEQKAMRAINKDGLNPERALQLLTIKEDMSTKFKEMTGMPCPMTMMGKDGLNNIRETEMALRYTDMGANVADMMTDKIGEMKMVMETINKEGATSERAMKLMTLAMEMGESFMKMTHMPSPMTLMKLIILF